MFGEIFSFIKSLTVDQKFELTKIFIDKVMLAAIVGVAGLVSTILIERWKSRFKRQEEYAKIALPAIISLIDDSKKLFDSGMKIIDELDYYLEDFYLWASKINDSE